MYQLIFRNWKFALLWAIGLTASAAAFFERGGGNDQLVARAQEIRQQRQGSPQPAAIASQPAAQEPPQAEEADAEQGDGPATTEAIGDEAEAPEQESQA